MSPFSDSNFGNLVTATHLFLVRHGETDFNNQGIVQGRGVNTSLNDTGLAQASKLAARFAVEQIDAIYSSPLTRAYQTASCAAGSCGIANIPTDPGLEEMSWGIFEGQSQSPELASAFEDMKRRWHEGEHDYRVEQGESLREVQSRGVSAVLRIVEAEQGKRVLVVAHGRFLRILLASLLTEYGVERMEELEHTNTGVNYLVHDGEQFTAEYLNCTKHL